MFLWRLHSNSWPFHNCSFFMYVTQSVIPHFHICPCTEETIQKRSYDPDNHNCVITHLEPDILECEVKWVLGNITRSQASGSDGIPAELFHILKVDAVKALHSICQQIWKTRQCPQDWKRSVFTPIPKKGNGKKMFKLPHNCTHLTC